MFIIVGDVSGIQDYLLDIVGSHGGQSRRLRARSFFLQAFSELAARRILSAAGWGDDCLLFSAAGKFLLRGPDLEPSHREAVERERGVVAEWLRDTVGARIRLALCMVPESPSVRESYNRALTALQKEKLRPWANIAVHNGEWNPEKLVLDPIYLDPIYPTCSICRRQLATASIRIPDEDSEIPVCWMCRQDDEMGRILPASRFMTIHDPSDGMSEYEIAGLKLSLHPNKPDTATARYVFDLSDSAPRWDGSAKIVSRRITRHIPTDNQGHPLDFDNIADQAEGGPYLGVLKMDVDSLGKAVDHILKDAGDWQPLIQFSQRLDKFFAVKLDEEMRQPKWSSIYTVFSGGDDLLLVGPWNIVFDFAFHVQQLFQAEFRDLELTISGGMALVKKKHPIRRAVMQADALLEQEAKSKPAPGATEAKDQFAAFGQIWKWRNHEAIAHHARCLTKWVRDNSAERGWLHDLLRFTLQRETSHLSSGSCYSASFLPDGLQRETNHLSSARLSYHITRNYPKENDPSPEKQALRRWANQIAADFEKGRNIETIYLSAIARYALLATREQKGGEDGT